MTADFAITVKDLCIQYRRFEVLKGISFSLPAGTDLAIIGPNGAGKTTLIKSLVGLIPPTSGEVSILGKPASHAKHELISYVPQVKTIDRRFPALVIELVVSGLHRRWPWRLTTDDRRKSMEALEQVGMSKLAERSLSELSGGELQRAYLARGIVRNPQVILLDEPSTGIDAPGEAQMYSSLEAYQQKSNATIVMITHDWSIARHHAHYVLLLNREQISYGTPKEALTDEHLKLAYGHHGHAHSMLMGPENGDSKGTCDHNHSEEQSQ